MARIVCSVGTFSQIVGLLLTTFLVHPAFADPMTVTYEGRILNIIHPEALDPSIKLFSTFTGTYTIDPDFILPGYFPIPGVGQGYPLLPGGGSTSATIAGIPFAGDLTLVLVADNSQGFYCPGCDAWDVSYGGPIGAIVPGVSFLDASGRRVTSSAFFVNDSLTGWDSADFGLFEILDDEGNVRRLAHGIITSLEVVPEPALTGLLMVGLLASAGLSTCRHRSRRTARR